MSPRESLGNRQLCWLMAEGKGREANGKQMLQSCGTDGVGFCTRTRHAGAEILFNWSALTSVNIGRGCTKRSRGCLASQGCQSVATTDSRCPHSPHRFCPSLDRQGNDHPDPEDRKLAAFAASNFWAAIPCNIIHRFSISSWLNTGLPPWTSVSGSSLPL